MPSDNRPTTLSQSALQSTGGYELVFSALLLGLAGYGLDRWLGTGPIFVVVLSILGFLGAALSLYYRFQLQMQELKAETGETTKGAGA